MIPVALSAATGYFLYTPFVSVKLLLIVSGVLLLAISASILNQIQEVRYDALMERTSKRPLVVQSLSPYSAYIILIFAFSAGSIILYYSGGIYPFLTGLTTLIWYNGVYTILKRYTAFAVVPGALTGALPPLIGYLGAGGTLNYPGIFALCFVLFMAQIPHFWMIQIRYGEEYKNAGLPDLKSLFNKASLERLNFIWVAASLVSAVLLPLFRVIISEILIYILIILSFLVLIIFLNRLFRLMAANEMFYFRIFNLYDLVLMILVILDKL